MFALHVCLICKIMVPLLHILLLLLLCFQALHSLGFRVVLDVVYNHTFASGPYSSNSVLDKIVPGYYHRRQEDGEICHSTCCNSKSSHPAGGATALAQVGAG